MFEHKASVRADQWARLGVELEIILTTNADVPRPKGKPYDKDSIAPYVGEARAGFELIEDRGADYSRLSVPWLVMDVGWNGGSLLAKANKGWRNLDLANLDGSISFDGKVVRSGHSGDVLGHCYNSLAWLANKLGEHGKTLKKGMIVSSGSMVACQFVPPGSTAVGKIEGLGEVTLKYELPEVDLSPIAVRRARSEWTPSRPLSPWEPNNSAFQTRPWPPYGEDYNRGLIWGIFASRYV